MLVAISHKKSKGRVYLMNDLLLYFLYFLFCIFFILPFILIVVGIWRGDSRGCAFYIIGSLLIFVHICSSLFGQFDLWPLLALALTWVSGRVYPEKGTYSRVVLKAIFSKPNTREKIFYYRNTAQFIIRSSQTSDLPSCEKTVMKYIDSIICNSFSEFPNWPQQLDYGYYDRLISPGIYNITSDLLNGPTYRTFGNLTNEGEQLYAIASHCLEHSKEKSFITDEEYQEQLNFLEYLRNSEDFSII